MRDYLWKVIALVLLALLLPVAMAAERVALVIGNSRYQHAPVLANTLNDAQAVADALQKLGFTLDGGQPYRDLTKAELEQVLKAFGPRARSAEAVVVYYAGHGVESSGANYLVPVDAELQHEVHLTLETVALDTILDQIAGSRGWRLVILDACRNNPLAARMVRGAGGRGVTRGLARVEPAGQTYVAYAAKAGTEALDQDPTGSGHSPFAAVLLDYLSQPLPLERLFGAVREDVRKRTGGQQEPWLYGPFGRDPIYLTGGDRELVFWNSVKDSRNPAVFRIYLERYPSGTFAKLAHIRLAELEPPAPPVTSPAPVVKPPAAAERVALVIGNGAYADRPLRNPVNDAADLAAALERLGFQVLRYTDLDRKGMHGALQAFRDALRGKELGLFYYAGHGAQHHNRNYLIPVQAEIRDAADLPVEALEADGVLAQMQSAGNTVSVVILDACRNLPYPGADRAGERGLARPDATIRGALVAYATGPGSVALDGDGRNSPYAAALLAEIDEPGVTLTELFSNVAWAVARATNNAQEPWFLASPLPKIYLAQAQESPPLPPPDRELMFWNSVKDSRNPADFRIYLDQYPSGKFANLAKIRLEELELPPRPPTIGRETVWNPPEGKWEAIESECLHDKVYMKCIASGMKRAGASPQAIAFTEMMHIVNSDEAVAYMSSFKEVGTVDVAKVTRPYTLRPGTSYILINGLPNIIELQDNFRKIDLKKDPHYQSFAKKFPEILLWTDYHDFEKMESLPQGGQRFIFKVIMLNGCHACEIAGWARIAFDLDQSGRLIATNLIGLTEE